MALTTKARSRWWSRLHFLIRFAGLTGLVCCGIGVALVFLKDIVSWEQLQSWALKQSAEFVRSTVLGEQGDVFAQVAISLLVGGGLLALLALLVEVLVLLFVVTGRRSAFGFNALVQAALAVALLIGVNLYSFRHYLRLDWTRQQQFTLPPETQERLRQLTKDSPTTIVVYQNHKTFGALNDTSDNYDFAAERKVVEKVKDLVEQFREFGPQFHVEVLDVKEEGFGEKLKELTKDAKELKHAIDSAPENSIFFCAGRKVQRLSFNDFYQLDKTASKERENLVLLYQGVEPFARKVLNIDQKRPQVGVLVTHELLSTEGTEEAYTLAGLKKALSGRGFDVRDVVLKKWSEFGGPPEPAVYTYDESKFERLEEQVAGLDADIKNLQDNRRQVAQFQDEWKKASLNDLTKKYAKRLRMKEVNEEERQFQLQQMEQSLTILDLALKQYRSERSATAKEKDGLNVESAAELRRISDLRAKLDRSLADCDLLFLPRMTIRNVNVGDRIPNWVHRLDDAQVDAIKDFIKEGKPILACLGPTNEPSDRPDPFGSIGPDKLETMLGSLGIHLAKQTILYNVESKSFAERRGGLILVSGANVEMPPVEFKWRPGAGKPATKPDTSGPKVPNPIRESMRIVTDSLGKDLDLRVRYPRPIYYESSREAKLEFEPEFMMTTSACWNDDNPFPSRERTPRYEPPKPDDPSRGTLDEKRLGPFPIGVAIQTHVPADWYSETGSEPKTVRVAAIGSGTLFVGPELSPAKEELLLNTCNWLLGREDLLPKSDRVWEYPRVALNAREHTLWNWGAWLGLPGLFAYFGLVVLMVRSLR